MQKIEPQAWQPDCWADDITFDWVANESEGAYFILDNWEEIADYIFQLMYRYRY